MKTLKRFFYSTVAILIMFASLRFLIDTGKYVFYSWDIRAIESHAEKGVWTADSLIKWPESDIRQYKKAVDRKEKFIKTSDVAKFYHYSAYSTTGKVIRIATPIIVAIKILYNSVDILNVSIKCLIRHIIATFQKVVRRRRRAYNRKKSRI